MSGALSLGVIGGADGSTAVFVTGSPAPLVIYLLAINVLAFAVYGWDKARSKVQGARRVPEKTLFLLAILGGSVGAILGMRLAPQNAPLVLQIRPAGDPACAARAGLVSRRPALKQRRTFP